MDIQLTNRTNKPFIGNIIIVLKKIFIALALLQIINLNHKLFSQVLLTELMYAPTFSDNEWFELYNSSETNSITISSWQVKDDAGKEFVSFTLGELKPLERAVVANDTVAFKREFPNYSCKITQPNKLWNAFNNTGGDSLIILNSSGTIIESFKYSTAWGAKNKDTGVVTLQKINEAKESGDSSNWVLKKPTPCREFKPINSVEAEVIFGKLNIYPNPTTRVITIDFGNNNLHKDILISDINGKALVSKNTTNHKLEIDVSFFLAGEYLVEIKLNNKRYSQKFVKSD